MWFKYEKEQTIENNEYDEIHCNPGTQYAVGILRHDGYNLE